MAFDTTAPALGDLTYLSFAQQLIDNDKEMTAATAYYNSAATQMNTIYRFQLCGNWNDVTNIAASGEKSVAIYNVSVPAGRILKVRQTRWQLGGATDLRLRIKDSSTTKYTSSAVSGDTDIATTIYDNSGGGSPSSRLLNIFAYNSNGGAAVNLDDQSTWWLDCTMY